MRFTDLENIKRNDQTELYDLNQKSFEFKPDIIDDLQEFVYTVTKDQVMRMDLVSDVLYGSPDFADFLMNINNIKNPLLIYEGLEIQYVPDNLISAFRPDREETNDIRERISNTRKQTKVDPNRKRVLDARNEKQSLPPTITKQDYTPVRYTDGRIRIGDGIFRV